MPTIKEWLEKDGWVVEDHYCWMKVGNFQVDIEFCIGDMCVGVFVDTDCGPELIEGKFRENSLVEALITANKLTEKYGDHGHRQV